MSDEDIDGFFSTARVAGREGAVELPEGDYRRHLYPLDGPNLALFRGMTYERFSSDRQQAPFLRELLDHWDSLLAEPYRGVTADGTVLAGLYPLPGGRNDASLAAAADAMLALLTPDERSRMTYPIDSAERRAWSNPEFVFHRVGIRLEDLATPKADAIRALIAATLSPAGWARVDAAMRLNGFLGELTELPAILNAESYWFAVYGTPSTDAPWGWGLFGHHVAMSFTTVAGRHVLAPAFIGAEPALSEELAPLFAEREARAIALAAMFTDAQRAAAVVYDSVLDPRMPEGRLHPADERHLGGAFSDNRLVPYEGIRGDALDESQWARLRELVEDWFAHYRDEQRALVLADVDAHRATTHLAWYGATDGSTPFYLRIQSPVVLAELDHHAGVWLSNRLPARFHVHTTLRLPNGNDYGNAYLEQWRARTTE